MTLRRLTSGAFALGLLGGCERAAPHGEVTSTDPEPPGSDAPPNPRKSATAPAEKPHGAAEPSPEQLGRALSARCERARGSGQLVLLELSASWCRDCRRLQQMKRDAALAEELGHFQSLTVDIGRFDRHTELLERFGVRAIAHWELLEPGDCAAPAWTWPKRGSRTLEPETGKQPVTPADLAEWLRARRDT